MGLQVDLSNYIHTYKAYRIPKGTTVQNAAGEDVVLSEDKDTLVLTAASSRQLVQDRRKLGEALTNEINEKCEKSQEKAWEKYAKDQAKVMAVFRSMSKGHIVSTMDESKLMEFDDKLYQAAKMAQTMAQLEEKRAKKDKSKWDEKEEEEYQKMMEQLRKDVDEAIGNVNPAFSKLNAALMDNIVEVDSSGVDFSDFKTIGLGGVVGEFIDLSV